MIGIMLKEFRFSRELGKRGLSSRVVDEWKSLGGQVMSASTIYSFTEVSDSVMDGSWWR